MVQFVIVGLLYRQMIAPPTQLAEFPLITQLVIRGSPPKHSIPPPLPEIASAWLPVMMQSVITGLLSKQRIPPAELAVLLLIVQFLIVGLLSEQRIPPALIW